MVSNSPEGSFFPRSGGELVSEDADMDKLDGETGLAGGKEHPDFLFLVQFSVEYPWVGLSCNRGA